MTQWHLKSPALRLVTQPFIQAQSKENIKAPRHWPLCGEFRGSVNSPHKWPVTWKIISIWWFHHAAKSYYELRVIKPLQPSDAIWWHRSGSPLAQLMACCLTAPSHYQRWCWLIIRKVQRHSSDFSFKSPRGQWVYVRHGGREKAGVIMSSRYTTTNCISHTSMVSCQKGLICLA